MIVEAALPSLLTMLPSSPLSTSAAISNSDASTSIGRVSVRTRDACWSSSTCLASTTCSTGPILGTWPREDFLVGVLCVEEVLGELRLLFFEFLANVGEESLAELRFFRFELLVSVTGLLSTGVADV